MCGLFFTTTKDLLPGSEKILRMRGNDEFSSIKYLKTRFEHSRLAITGVANGSQPFQVEDTIAIVNGQIYNFNELIETYNLSCKTSSDCEVLHLLYCKLGERAFSLIEGMYAFILLDKN